MKTSEKSLKSEKNFIDIPQEQKAVQESKLSSALDVIWQFLMNIFTKQPELKIRYQTDRLGNTWWNIYDPITGCYKTFGSEYEALKWIEKRYHQ